MIKNRFAQVFAEVTRNILARTGRLPSQAWAKARPAGTCTLGHKHGQQYRTRYTNVMTEMATENNLRRIAHRNTKRRIKTA